MHKFTLWVGRNSPPGKQVSNLVADPRDMNCYNINVKHGSDEPDIPGTSGQERIPGFARFQDFYHRQIITANFYSLVGPYIGPDFECYNNIQHFKLGDVEVHETDRQRESINLIAKTSA